MNSLLLANIFRFLGLLILQVLILVRVDIGPVAGSAAGIYAYPLFVLLLPLRTSREALMLYGFLLGISVDIFNDTPGLHASSTVLIAFLRPYLLKRLTPKGGYILNQGLTANRLGYNWFLRYAGGMLLLHLTWLHIFQQLSFFPLVQLLVKTGVSFVLSLVFILILVAVFNPKD